jgi:hypothetical protein
MDCSLLIGRQLDELDVLSSALEHAEGGTGDLIVCRELRDRAAAHFQVREQIVLPALQRGGWKGLNNEALAAHVELKRLLAALCICEPGHGDFTRLLRNFRSALEQQRLADKEWIVPSLRRSTGETERRRLCEEIERLHEALVPPREHYLGVAEHRKPGVAVLQDAAIVLGSIGAAHRNQRLDATE